MPLSMNVCVSGAGRWAVNLQSYATGLSFALRRANKSIPVKRELRYSRKCCWRGSISPAVSPIASWLKPCHVGQCRSSLVLVIGTTPASRVHMMLHPGIPMIHKEHGAQVGRGPALPRWERPF